MRIQARLLGTPFALIAAFGAGMGGSAPLAAQAVAPSPPVVQMNSGRGQLINLPAAMTDVFVADDRIADVQVRSAHQLYVFGKAPGETTIHAVSRSGATVYAATVRVGNNITTLGDMLALAMPDAQITTTPMNNMVLLTGTVRSPDDIAEAQTLAQAFVGANTQVLSRLKTATPMQVNLQVRIAEVSRSYVKNIGVNLTSRDSGGFLFNIGQGRQGSFTVNTGDTVNESGAAPGGTSVAFPGAPEIGTTLGIARRLLGLDLLASLDLGERNGQVTTLANPNLTAVSGETGTFLAGGEIPIPIAQGGNNAAISVEYKQYGVSLAYTPTVLSDGRITLRVRPEVSQITTTGAVELNNITIPALTTRRAETTVELGSGQSFMIAGLLSNSHDNSVDQAPFLANLPIIGSLFRSNAFQRNETELVIVITPYLVKPVDANQIVLPTDGYRAPNDAERVLWGQPASRASEGPRPVPTLAPSAPTAPVLGAPLPAGPNLPVLADDRAGKRKNRKAPATPGFSNQ